MPLIILTGVPCSGKTSRANELVKYFQSENKTVHVISEQEEIKKAGYDKNIVYSDANKEKHIRGLLKSEVLRLITPNDVVVFDGLNYIKGYRYELYCGSKANKCTQCTIHTEINRDEAWKFNENQTEKSDVYSKEVFDALIMRYEEPDGKNRWDSPLFMLFPHEELDTAAIYSCLFQKAPPKPNMSTQNAPLSSTNYLYELDQTTKTIMDFLIKAKNERRNSNVKIPDSELYVDVSKANIQNLIMLRRQFINYSK